MTLLAFGQTVPRKARKIKMNSRLCPFHGCPEIIPPDLFACRPHWYSLKESARVRIGWAYREWKAGALTIEELRKVQQDILGDKGNANRS